METTVRMPRAQLEWLRARTRRDDDLVLPLVRRKPPLVRDDALDGDAPAARRGARVWIARVLALAVLAAALALLFAELRVAPPW